MNAENYLKVHIGKVYRYDKQPKYFTESMVINLMEGYAKHKASQITGNNAELTIGFINRTLELMRAIEAIKELENDLQKSQSKIDMLTDGMDTIYHLFREVDNEAVIELRKEIDRLQNESKMARSLCNAIEHDRFDMIGKLAEAKDDYQRAVKLCDKLQSERTEALIKLDEANKTIDELRGQLQYEQNKT